MEEATMQPRAATEQVLEIIVRSSQCDLEEVAFACPGLTWNQVFMAIDRLSREGAVNLQFSAPGRYTVSFNTSAPNSGSPPPFLDKERGRDISGSERYLASHTGARPTT
jgi:hypothetical protein